MNDKEKIAALEAERAEAAQTILALTQEILKLRTLLRTISQDASPYWFARSCDGTVVGPFSRS